MLAETDSNMGVLGHAKEPVRIPVSTINRGHTSYAVSGAYDSPAVSPERAYIWRHPELTGVELFRGVYTRYQAARHFLLGPAIGIVVKGGQ